MKILKATEDQIIEILYLMREYASALFENSSFNLSNQFLTYQYLKDTCDKESLYIIKRQQVCVGMVIINQDIVKEFEPVNWEDDEKAFYFSYLLVSPSLEDKNIGLTMLDYINSLAHENDYTSLHTYAFIKDKTISDFLSNNYFKAVEESRSNNSLLPYMAMEKVF